MRLWSVCFVLLLACNSSGTQAGPADGAVDATSAQEAATSLDYEAGDDGGSQDTGAPPCISVDASLAYASSACVYTGTCPLPCSTGTASGYACLAGPDASASYPATFHPPADTVEIVSFQSAAYPWDAAAYVSCAGLACTRWSTGDHVDGGSEWPSDPCSDDGGPATEAWTCPTVPGVVPPVTGCFSAGDLQRIGGPGTGLAVNAVWCCPPVASPPDEAGTDAGTEAAASDASPD